MAINIEFTGFVNGVREFEWGVVYDMAHAQMMKDDQGEWKVAGKDYLSVTGPKGFNEGDQCLVIGTLKTKTFEKKDGSKGIALNVRAREMKIAERRQQSNKQGVAALNEVWPVAEVPGAIDEQAPF